MRRHTASFANFICKFGKSCDLLDYAQEIVIPAFLHSTEARRRGYTTYLFMDVRLANAGTDADPLVGLAGRFVKSTLLRRTQIIDSDNSLQQDEQTMESAPSSFFFLMLANHRLILFGETPDAPDLKMFSLASNAIINREYKDFIDRNFLSAQRSGNPITKKALREIHEPPSVTVIPLTSQSDVASFVNRYSKLQFLEFDLIRPNSEIDARAMWRALRETNDALGATSTTVEHRNSEGLEKEAAIKEIADAAATGNQLIKMRGIDENGNKLDGNNENYQLNVNVTNPPAGGAGLIQRLVDIFKGLLASGDIKIDSSSETSNSKKATDIYRQLK